METSDLQETSPLLLWETSKAVMRGKIISYSVHKKKKDQEKQSSLEQHLKQLQSSYAENPTEKILKNINKIKAQLDTLIDQKTQFLLLRLRQNHFEHNDKSGKFLANQLKQNKEKHTITTIHCKNN